MFKKAMIAGVIGSAMTLSAEAMPVQPQPAPQNQSMIVQVSDGEYCDWFAIINCSKKRGSAVKKAASRLGGKVIHTDDIDNFRDGWYCAVIGPSGKSQANRNRKQARNAGYKSAYIKEGCNY